MSNIVLPEDKVSDQSGVSGKNAPKRPPINEFDLAEIAQPVARLVEEIAMRDLMPRFRRVAAERKHDGSVVTEADRVVEAALAEALPRIVDCPVLGEEMDMVSQRQLWANGEWFWCVDPLDGTANFAAGKRSFGISVALMHRRRSVFGMVLDPNRDELFHAHLGGGAWLTEKHAAAKRLKPQPTVALADAYLEIGRYKRLGRLQSALRANPPSRKVGQIGASVLQWCHLAASRVDVFLHAGEHPWDYAAGALILEEAGGRTATLTHDDYWRGDADAMWEQSVIAARHPALFEDWKRWVRQHV
jgi:myo-inositol-1(or 4)-monophosphatase